MKRPIKREIMSLHIRVETLTVLSVRSLLDLYAAYDIRRPICDSEFFFQPSQYFVNIHLNSLVIRFFPSHSGKIANLRQRIFFPTFSIFCKHTSKFTCHPIFFPPTAEKSPSYILGVGCCKPESDTCEQPNINEKKGKVTVANQLS